ncbi:HSP20-like chaperone [Podospora aff. communis PSN243]|uniref:HSP20-like chaperone n=1 Tax=Podospora aff. communis PSN243 TaxID=3040156 RepID=A0AAV9GER7_9PEZI|nr:HSP20-like chaperone [Podospora aff. communis PSN243]
MAAFITRHLPQLSAPRQLSSIHDDGLKTTVIPPLPLNPPLRVVSPSPPSEPTSPAAPPTPTHVLDPDTLHHFLHAFHEHYTTSPQTTTSASGAGTSTTHPHFDLVESKTTYTIYGELPGLKRNDITVETNDLMFTVTISGVLRRSIPTEVENLEELAEQYGGEDDGKNPEEGLYWHVKEREVGRFKREFQLPVGLGNMAGVKASMEDGLLVVSVPKTVAEVYREGVQHRRVSVGEGSGKHE